MNNMRRYITTNQARIFTLFLLTGILSIGNGLILVKDATASIPGISPDSTTEVVQQKATNKSLPHSVAKAVLQDLAQKEGISPRKLKITKHTQKTWSNGCLDLPKAGEVCTEALVPGWQVVVFDGKQNWIYHSNSNGRSLRLENQSIPDNKGDSKGKASSIPTIELPPALAKGVVFRQISSGGIVGRSYETFLLADGMLIKTPIGANSNSKHIVHRVSPQNLQEFQQLLAQSELQKLQNLSYSATSGAADYITYTLTSSDGTVQYNDVSQDNLPENLQTVIKAWNNLQLD